MVLQFQISETNFTRRPWACVPDFELWRHRADIIFSKSWPCIYIPILLGLPVLYSSRASNLLLHTAARNSEQSGQTSNTSDDAMDRNADSGSMSPPQPLMLEMRHGSFQKKVQEVWKAYIDARVVEWKVLFTLACIFATIALTIFQIPKATDDPLTRILASLAVCRAFSSVVYGPIFLMIFRSSQTQTVRFAMTWSKDCINSKGRLWNPWIMISLPAASTLWALLFDLATILSFTMRLNDSNSEDRHMTLELSAILRGMIMISTLMDIACLFGIWITLQRYKHNDPSVEGGFPPLEIGFSTSSNLSSVLTSGQPSGNS